MDAGGICVARTLPIDAALIADVLIHLRRDTPGRTARWTLGERGVAEVEIDFFPALTEGEVGRPAWTTTARLWDPEGVALVHAVVELSTTSVEACELTIRPRLPLTPWWTARLPALLDLARAAVDEMGEELLWHATRDSVTTGL